MSRCAAALLAALLLAACGGAGGDGGPDGGGAALSPTTPALAAGRWHELPGEDGTGCALGEPFSFFVYPGKVNRVVIDFMGGGACWDDFTCTLQLPPPDERLYTASVSRFRGAVERAAGVYDKTRPDNPLRDWFHVVVPYCTGDIHWGDNVMQYQEPGGGMLTVRHKGAVNARTVLDWVARSFSRPEALLVTGCSAGAYGSILWAPHVQRRFPDVPLFQLGDSGAGVVTPGFFATALPNWNALAAAPAFIPALDPGRVAWEGLTLADIYQRVGQHLPTAQLSQFNTEYDSVQVGFYTLMKGSYGNYAQEWSDGLRASLAAITQGAPRFSSFLAPGTAHCVLPSSAFYTLSSGGVRFVDYVEALVSGAPLPEVRCTGCDGGT